MKLTQIFKTTALSLGAVLALSGCIRETFPKESAITEEQLLSGQMEVVAENLLKGIPSGLMSYVSGWEHTDFGYHSVGVYNDHACGLITSNGWMTGLPAGYDRFYPAAYSWGYASNSSMPSHVWYNYYPQIKSCNDLIKILEGNEQLKHYSGIARAYRAMMYIDLARMFECLYAENDNNPNYATEQLAVVGLTVPIVDENLDEEGAKNNPRATREELFNFIFADLKFCEDALAEYVPTSITNPDLAVVYGLYARAKLYEGEYADAKNYAELALASGSFAPLTKEQWTSVTTGFNDADSQTSWMLCTRTSSESSVVKTGIINFASFMSNEQVYGYGGPGAGAYVEVDSKFYSQIPNTDFRKLSWKAPAGHELESQNTFVPATDDYPGSSALPELGCIKFRPGDGNPDDYMTGSATDFPMMRMEEMKFIIAECDARLNNDATALVDIVKTRNAEYACSLTGEDLLREVFFQKRVEFWGEGINFFDYKRLGKGVTRGYAGTNHYEDARLNSSGLAPWYNFCIVQTEHNANPAVVSNPDPSDLIEPWQE